ncbi:MAG: protein TolR [Gammaproteobacteria bacterium]|nr:protein TolR [Gammaproteobacteria bacterium]
MSEINVVPYIDVMLVLLVIFMITAPLLAQGVKVDLPQVASEPLQGRVEEPLIVSVDAAGNAFLNYGEGKDKPIDAETLVNRVNALLRRNPGLSVLVKGDKDAAYGDVVRIMALLQSAGTHSVGLITIPPEPAGG